MKQAVCILMLLSLLLFTGCSELEPFIRDVDLNYTSSEYEAILSTNENESSSQKSVAPDSEKNSSSSSSSLEPESIKITIPEGYTLPKIGMLLSEKRICTTNEFIEAAQTGDFSEYSFIANQPSTTNRCYKLEGYLFPDTYEIYITESPDSIIRRMLSNTQRRLADLTNKIGQSGYSLDEIITLASIIEKESLGNDIMYKVSSVLHNRLDNGMKLECDVTRVYVEQVIKPFITGDKDRFSADYSTYRCAALPAGAICNPGMAAIEAALNPDKSDYYYFVTDKDGNFYFSKTYEDHLKTCDEIGIVIPE